MRKIPPCFLALLILLSATAAHAEPVYKCVFFKTFANGQQDRDNFRSVPFDPRDENPDVEIGQIDDYVAFIFAYPNDHERLGIDLCNEEACYLDRDTRHVVGESLETIHVDETSGHSYSVSCKPQK